MARRDASVSSVDPADRVTLDDEVRLALLIMLERLGPGVRAKITTTVNELDPAGARLCVRPMSEFQSNEAYRELHADLLTRLKDDEGDVMIRTLGTADQPAVAAYTPPSYKRTLAPSLTFLKISGPVSSISVTPLGGGQERQITIQLAADHAG